MKRHRILFERAAWAGFLGLTCSACFLLSPAGGSGPCGDGVVDREAGETCDGNCPTSCADTNACTQDSMEGGPDTCDVTCRRVPIRTCVAGDGCCPAGCGPATDSDCSATCGNGTKDPGETCDPPGSCPTSCDDHDSCTVDSITGSAANCNAACSNEPISVCQGGDSCCPLGCNQASDSDCTYPSGPYGTEVGQVVSEFEVEESLCQGSVLKDSQIIKARQFVGAKATLVVVSSGTCESCKQMAASLEADFHQAYKSKGLKLVYVLFADDADSQERDELLPFCCLYGATYGMTFPVAADPGHWAFRRYHTGVPLTLVLDPSMRITYKMDGQVPATAELRQAIQKLLP